MERKLNKSIAGASREGIRAYARGRLYDPERYPTFPYQDPNEIIKAREEEQRRLMEEKKAAKQAKKKGKQEIPAQTETAASVPAAETPSPAPEEEKKHPNTEPSDPVQPTPAVQEEEEEGFVEESFLEEPEGDDDKKN